MEKVKTYKLINGKRIDTGETYERDSEWKSDEQDFYIVGINNWIVNKKGEFLVQRRSLTKKNNPGKYSSTNGLIQLNETSIDTVIRETKEELDVDISKDKIILVEESHVIGGHLLVDIFLTIKDISLEDITIQENEVDLVKYVSLEELMNLDISTTCSYIKELAPKIYDIYKKNI